MESYQNTWLAFKCSGDAAEIFEHNLPTPHYFQRESTALYAIGWLINGFFHTSKGVEYLNDIIARITLTIPITERYYFAPANQKDYQPLHLSAFQNAVSLRTEYIKQRIKHSNDASKDMVWWAIKYQTESYIRQFKGWFNYDLLETWAFTTFEIGRDVKDKSTLRAKCRSTWSWYEERNFTIPKHQRKSKMSRAEAGRSSAAKKAEKTKAKVIAAVAALEFLKEKVNPTNIARHAGIHRETAAKYLKELTNPQK